MSERKTSQLLDDINKNLIEVLEENKELYRNLNADIQELLRRFDSLRDKNEAMDEIIHSKTK